jgi:hypothetical protein
MSKKRKILLSLTSGILVSGAALYLTFRNVPLQELLNYLRLINYWWVLPSVFFVFIGFVIRVIRWQLLLSPVKKVPFFAAFHPLMIGFALNCVIPARLGEVARPVIFSKKERSSFPKVLATVGVERVLDVLVLLGFFAVVAASVDIAPNLELSLGGYHLDKSTLDEIAMATVQLALLMVLGILLISVEKTRNLMRKLILISPNLLFFLGATVREKIRQKICPKLIHILDNFAMGFHLLRSPWKTVLCLLLSFVAWVFAGLSHYVLSLGSPGVTVTFSEMIAVMVILCFFISLPSVPGYWGLWEAGGVFGLLIFGVPYKEAAGFTLVNHFFQMVPVILVGLASLVIMGVDIAQLRKNAIPE